MAEADAGAVLNHNSNLKLKSGVAPILDMREAGMRVGLGCDNCSGSDVQNMFQSMKAYCMLAAVSAIPPPVRRPRARGAAQRAPWAARARPCSTTGSGAIKPGYTADLVRARHERHRLPAFNSAARQLVYTETGRGSITDVIIDGRVVIREPQGHDHRRGRACARRSPT